MLKIINQNIKTLITPSNVHYILGKINFQISRNQRIITRKQLYKQFARSYLEKALQLNKNNYRALYLMGLINYSCNQKGAKQYCIECCKSKQKMSFLLLSCIYLNNNMHNNALKIIKQVNNHYNKTGLIYYIKAIIYADKLLNNLFYEQQRIYAKQGDQETYKKYLEMYAQKENTRVIFQSFQNYFTLELQDSIYEYDQNFFCNLVQLVKLQCKKQYSNPQKQNFYQLLERFLKLLVQLHLFKYFKSVVKSLSDKTQPQILYYVIFYQQQGIVAQQQGQIQKAIQIHQTNLKNNFYQFRVALKLSILYFTYHKNNQNLIRKGTQLLFLSKDYLNTQQVHLGLSKHYSNLKDNQKCLKQLVISNNILNQQPIISEQVFPMLQI